MNTTNPYAPPQAAVAVRSDGSPVSVARMLWLRNVFNTIVINA